MQHVNGVTNQVVSFIYSQTFFDYHGAVLAFLWFIASTIAILARRFSRQLHSLLFFFIDFITAFFIIGAIVRVYPYFGYFATWSLVKKGHILGGIVFLVLLLIQHASGVYTLLKGIGYNPIHRKLGAIVASLGKFLAVGGMVLSGWPQHFIILGSVLAVLMSAFAINKNFGKQTPKKESKVAANESSSQAGRQRSPPREVKRD